MVGRCGVVPGCVQEKQRIGCGSDDCRGVDCGSDDYLPGCVQEKQRIDRSSDVCSGVDCPLKEREEEGLQFMVGRCGVVPGCVQEKQRIGRSSDDCRGVDCGSDDYLPSWLDVRAPPGRGTLRRAIPLG